MAEVGCQNTYKDFIFARYVLYCERYKIAYRMVNPPIVHLLVSVGGSLAYKEWLEIQSTRMDLRTK